MRFKEGDKVRIIENIWGHNFGIGEIVTISSAYISSDDYAASNGEEEYFVCDEEIEEVIE